MDQQDAQKAGKVEIKKRGEDKTVPSEKEEQAQVKTANSSVADDAVKPEAAKVSATFFISSEEELSLNLKITTCLSNLFPISFD